MRRDGKIKLGFFPLSVAEADRLRNCLILPGEFSALDPCVGDGVAFTQLLKGTVAHRYGIEIDANRTEQARALGIEIVQANTMDVRCPAETLSLIYLNPMILKSERQITKGWSWYFWSTPIAGSGRQAS